MPSISTLSPIKKLPKPEEVSVLRSPRDSSTLYNSWKRDAEVINSQNKLVELMNQMSRELEKIKGRKKLDLDFYPFKIYTLADQWRGFGSSGSYSLSNNWQTVRVRGGQVLTNRVDYSGSFVYGTDNSIFPDYDTFPIGWNYQYDIVIPPTSSQYWFWIESLTGSLSGSNYILQYGTGSQIASYYVQTPWSTFPSASTTHIPIGYVDNNSSSSIQRLMVRQFLREDLISNGGSNSSTSTQWFIYAGMGTSYLNCYIWDPTTGISGSVLTSVALPPKINPAISQELIPNVGRVTYSWNLAGQSRTATIVNSSITEPQTITPNYLSSSISASVFILGDVLLATSTQTSSSGVIWQDLNLDGRAMAWSATS